MYVSSELRELIRSSRSLNIRNSNCKVRYFQPLYKIHYTCCTWYWRDQFKSYDIDVINLKAMILTWSI